MRKSVEQQIREQDDRITKLEYTARIGAVTNVNGTDRTARVSWANGTQSGDMKILRTGETWTPKVGDMVISLHRPSGDGWIVGRL